MSIHEFTGKSKSQEEQPQESGLQYGDMLIEARRDIERARRMFSFLSRATREIMRNNAQLTEEEISGFDWCMYSGNVDLQTSYRLLGIELNALGRLEDE